MGRFPKDTPSPQLSAAWRGCIFLPLCPASSSSLGSDAYAGDTTINMSLKSARSLLAPHWGALFQTQIVNKFLMILCAPALRPVDSQLDSLSCSSAHCSLGQVKIYC